MLCTTAIVEHHPVSAVLKPEPELQIEGQSPDDALRALLAKVDAPNSANKSVHREWLMLELREPWTVGGKAYKAGSLLVSKPTRVGELWRSAQFWATKANTVQPATR